MAYYNSDLTQETITLKETSGLLERVIVNKKGTSGTTITLYDGLDVNAPVIGTLHVDLCDTYVDYNLEFTNGLTIKTSNASSDLTLVFK
jgi:hypothetical protein